RSPKRVGIRPQSSGTRFPVISSKNWVVSQARFGAVFRLEPSSLRTWNGRGSSTTSSTNGHRLRRCFSHLAVHSASTAAIRFRRVTLPKSINASSSGISTNLQERNMTDFIRRILRPEHPDWIIRSLLDVDFYKFTMGLFIFRYYRGV